MQELNTTVLVPEKREEFQTSLVRPVASVADIARAWQDYEELKRTLLNPDDYFVIDNRPRIKKSGWRKIQTAFGISDEVINEERKEYKGYYVYLVTVKAIAQNGRFAFAVGSCASNERRFAHAEHDIRSTAHTRAKNRAISDLVGGGEVTAEELTQEEAPPMRTQSPFEPQAEYIGGENKGWDDSRFKDPATDKQKVLLKKLIEQRFTDEHERSIELKNIQNITKREASFAISDILSNR